MSLVYLFDSVKELPPDINATTPNAPRSNRQCAPTHSNTHTHTHTHTHTESEGEARGERRFNAPLKNMARLSEHGIRLSSMSPSFLNSNSTSHTWPFSAVAEIIDNASDPGVFARQIWIDESDQDGQPCLTFTDNGSGMTPNSLHKMLSFGFTDKGSGRANKQAIGVYGNGFKSGSMRLGRDALIFTKNGGCQTVGMLSQTYLNNIKAQAVIVPIAPFSQISKTLVVTEDSEASLAAILSHSIVTSVEQIHTQFDSIPAKKGTKILIWNIRRANDGKPELDFDTDVTDFRLPKIKIEDMKKSMKSSGSLRAQENIPEMYYSLKAYLSILYLKPRTQVILRGKKIAAKLVEKRLKHIEHDVYKPHFSKDKVKVTFGVDPKNKDHYGIMMYHKNRLIKAYEKVGWQMKSSGQRVGVGVIGVIECNFLKPAHNKQDFEYTKEYRLTLGALGIKLNNYWKEGTDKKAREREIRALHRGDDKEEKQEDEGPMWLQCEDCLKWRIIPTGHYTAPPENWKCSQNPNPRYRSCSSKEESGEEHRTSSYQRAHKKDRQLQKSRKRARSMGYDEYQPQQTKHQVLSRSSSESNQPVSQNTHDGDEADAGDDPPVDDSITTHTDDDDEDDDDDDDDDDYDEDYSTSTAEVTPTQKKRAERDANAENQTADGLWDTHVVGDVEEHSTVTRAAERQATKRDTVQNHAGLLRNKQAQTQAPSETNDEPTQRLAHEDEDENTDANMEPVEKQQEKTEKLSQSKEPERPFYRLTKKLRFLDEQQPANKSGDSHAGKVASIPGTSSSELSEQDSGRQEVKSGQATPQSSSSLVATHSFPFTQTMVVSPLSRRRESWTTTLAPEGSDREVKVKKLADLQNEAQRLRRVLGVELNKTSRGTMTRMTPLAPIATRDACTQTDTGGEQNHSSTSTSTSSGQGQALKPLEEEAIQSPNAVCGQREQPEQKGEKKEKSATQGRIRHSDVEDCVLEETRTTQEHLFGLRKNVVALLTSILPQVNLAGISLDTADVDGILQQIIDVNSLKL
ncbi:uncharacterized protein LOC143008054 [Genypterus blacodes]|uniref:uncharacterized protein LOC143008054 n=1 Tax=Genypterus blacodes TaxID=154954 RepID=UPI003F75961C